MDLKTISSINIIDSIIYPFALQSIDDVLIHRTKTFTQVITSRDEGNNWPHKLNFSSLIRTPKPTETPSLNINSQKVFDNCSMNEKNFLMLNQYYLTDCTLKSIQYIQSEAFPRSENNEYLLACLTTSGIIELYTYNILHNTLIKRIEDTISDVRKANLKVQSGRQITKFSELYSTYNNVAFKSFDWLTDQSIPSNYRILIASTKNKTLVVYRIDVNSIIEIGSKSTTNPNVVHEKIKCIKLKNINYLVSGTMHGNLMCYKLELSKDFLSCEILEIDEIEGKLKIPINYIKVDYCEESTVLLCSKTHTLEVFYIRDGLLFESITKYIDISITGIEVLDNLKYFISSLNSKIYYVELSVQNYLKINTFEKVTINSGETNFSSINSIYGIGISRNKCFVYLSCYPQMGFDHLTVRQPAKVTITTFSKVDPFKLLIENPTLKLTYYSDCIEAVSCEAMHNISKLTELEQIDYTIGLTEEFLYYLKLQLVIVKMKMVFYRLKIISLFKLVETTKNSLVHLIQVISSYLLMDKIMKHQKNPTSYQIEVLRCLSIKVKKYCANNVDMEPFKTASEVFRPQLENALLKCKNLLKSKQSEFKPEKCEVCDEEIDLEEENCTSQHPSNRCSITNLKLPLDNRNFCGQCKLNVASLDILKWINGNLSGDDKNFFLCPLCDTKLTFY
jgi:hypothetical protein